MRCARFPGSKYITTPEPVGNTSMGLHYSSVIAPEHEPSSGTTAVPHNFMEATGRAILALIIRLLDYLRRNAGL